MMGQAWSEIREASRSAQILRFADYGFDPKIFCDVGDIVDGRATFGPFDGTEIAG